MRRDAGPDARMSNPFPGLKNLLRAAAGFTRGWMTFCIRVALARRRHLDERTLFLGQYILHALGIRPIRAITCVRRSGAEGAGSQAHLIVNAINFARISGLTYVHTPFEMIHHSDRPAKEWLPAWEQLFNLGDGEVVHEEPGMNVVNYCYGWSELERGFGWTTRRRELTQAFKTMIPDIRRKYYVNKSARPSPSQLTVAVHIRRGDVNSQNTGHYTSTDKIEKIINGVKNILDEHRLEYKISIYSQGHPAEFSRFQHSNVRLSLNTDPIEALKDLIQADILVMSKGFFSYYAGLVSEGIKIFEPRSTSISGSQFLPSWVWMDLYPADDWIRCHPDGSIEQVAFQRQLYKVIERYPK